jgi:putative ABC transport system permease protein
MLAVRLYRLLLLAYPPALRRSHGDEMCLAVAERWRERSGPAAHARLVGDLLVDFIRSLPRAWRSPRPSGHPAPPGRQPMRDFFSSDVRGAVRVLAHAPLFTLGATVTLALGIGASTAIFSLASATLLHPLPIDAPDRVLQVNFSWSPADVWDLAATQRLFTDVGGWSTQDFGLTQDGVTTDVTGAAVTGGYFPLTGLTPVVGRFIGPGDDQPGAAPVVVLGERLWQRTFHADRSVIGRTVVLNRRDVRIVGVAPADFRGLSLGSSPELYVALRTLPQIGTGFVTRPGLLENRDIVWISVAGRLRDGVTPDQAAAEVNAIYRRAHPPAAGSDPPAPVTLDPVTARAVGLRTLGDLRHLLEVLISATCLTLLLACASVANLLLVRAERRRRELAMRLALGASRWRIVRLLVTESAAIGVVGALAGLGVARAGLSLLGAFTLPGDIAIADLGLTLDLRMLAIAMGLGVATSLTFGLAPLWQAANVTVAPVLRDGERASTRQPMRTVLVTAQVALCVLLVAGSLAFGRAVRHALSVDLGFDATDRTSLTTTDSTLARYTQDQTIVFENRVIEALAATTWAEAAGWSMMSPLHGRMQWTIGVAGYQPAPREDMGIDTNVVSPGYFRAMHMRVLRGRDFLPADRDGGEDVAVVNDALVRKYFGSRPALDARLNLDPDSDRPRWARIVGVVNDVRRGLQDPPLPTVYLPVAQNARMLDFGGQVLVVRSSLDGAAALHAVSTLLGQVDANVPVVKRQTVRDQLGAVLMPQRLGLTLFTLFGGLALLLTTLGIYAVVAYGVAHRTREIGIRVALGAAPGGILRLVALQGLRPVGLGLAVGLAGFWLSAKSLQRFMFALPAGTPASIGLLAGAIGGVALLAMLLPARRALAIDPARALRND